MLAVNFVLDFILPFLSIYLFIGRNFDARDRTEKRLRSAIALWVYPDFALTGGVALSDTLHCDSFRSTWILALIGVALSDTLHSATALGLPGF